MKTTKCIEITSSILFTRIHMQLMYWKYVQIRGICHEKIRIEKMCNVYDFFNHISLYVIGDVWVFIIIINKLFPMI